jgi:hypothetical protein
MLASISLVVLTGFHPTESECVARQREFEPR